MSIYFELHVFLLICLETVLRTTRFNGEYSVAFDIYGCRCTFLFDETVLRHHETIYLHGILYAENDILCLLKFDPNANWLHNILLENTRRNQNDILKYNVTHHSNVDIIVLFSITVDTFPFGIVLYVKIVIVDPSCSGFVVNLKTREPTTYLANSISKKLPAYKSHSFKILLND